MMLEIIKVKDYTHCRMISRFSRPCRFLCLMSLAKTLRCQCGSRVDLRVLRAYPPSPRPCQSPSCSWSWSYPKMAVSTSLSASLSLGDEEPGKQNKVRTDVDPEPKEQLVRVYGVDNFMLCYNQKPSRSGAGDVSRTLYHLIARTTYRLTSALPDRRHSLLLLAGDAFDGSIRISRPMHKARHA